LERHRDRERRNRTRHQIPIAGVHEQSTLYHGLGQFLDEQRHAVGPIGDLVGDLLGQDLAMGDVRDHLGALVGWQSAEAEHCHVGTADPRRYEFRAVGHYRQKRQARRPLDDQVEKLERGGIDPMRVLNHHKHRLTRCQSLDLRYQRPQRLLLALLRGEIERGIAITCRNR
jgi:hypothetical protein